MVPKSAKEMLMEMAINKVLEHLPPETVDDIKQIGVTVAGFKAQLERIEKQNDRILLLLSRTPQDYQTEDKSLEEFHDPCAARISEARKLNGDANAGE
jgi:hypothetical protein